MVARDPGVERHAEEGLPSKLKMFYWVRTQCWSADNQMSSRRQHSRYMVLIIIFDVLFTGLFVLIS